MTDVERGLTPGQAGRLVLAPPQREPFRPRKAQAECRVHGLRAALPGSRMCSYPQCVEKWLRATSYRSGYIRRGVSMLDSRRLMDDFVSHMYESYMWQYRNGKAPMMRPQWMIYELSNFFRKRKNWPRGEVLMDPLGSGGSGSYADMMEKDVDFESALHEHLGETSELGIGDWHRKHLELREVVDEVVATGGAISLLVLREDITVAEAWVLDERKRKMGQTIAQRALEVEFCLCWVRLWSKYQSKEVEHGTGRTGDFRSGRGAGWADGYDAE